MELPAGSLTAREAYGLLTSVVVPRPIAWVATLAKDGRKNLAPFSYFTGVCADPPTIALGIGNRPDGTPKDTYRNIADTGVFTVNLVEEEFARPMNVSSGAFDYGVDEFTMAGVVSEPCRAIPCVRVKGARAVLECRLVDTHVYGNRHKVNLTVGEVVHAFLADELAVPGKKRADADKIQPVARLGGVNYAKLGERFQLTRPKV
jgi:flavin reductase (DIM6/NTAB) family NADH-FMN oxidoreductase RutF